MRPQVAAATALVVGLTAATTGAAAWAHDSDGATAASAPASAPAGARGEGGPCMSMSIPRTVISGQKPQTFVYTAPEGRLVTHYCVEAQAGSTQYLLVQTPSRTVTLRNTDGKALLAYSVLHVPAATPAPTPTHTPTSTPLPTEQPTATEQPTPTEEPSPTEEPVTEADLPQVTGPVSAWPDGSFNFDWKYDAPTCTGLTVLYPANIPDHQTNDVNVRIALPSGERVTLNYHLDGGDWTGLRAFNYFQHPRWPAGTTEFKVEWTQVGGSNYHYGESFHNAPVEGPLLCRTTEDGDPGTLDVPRAVTSIAGFDTAPATLRQGQRASTDTVVVVEPGLSALQLERSRAGSDWQVLATVPAEDGKVFVGFPKERKRGLVSYRLSVPGTESVTGAVTAELTVEVLRKRRKGR